MKYEERTMNNLALGKTTPKPNAERLIVLRCVEGRQPPSSGLKSKAGKKLVSEFKSTSSVSL
jgi:hypothetical protein